MDYPGRVDWSNSRWYRFDLGDMEAVKLMASILFWNRGKRMTNAGREVLHSVIFYLSSGGGAK